MSRFNSSSSIKTDNLIVNALEFGVRRLEDVPSFDSTTALNNAISSAASNGIELYIPAGSYKTTAPLTSLSSNVMIRGAGGKSTIIKPSASTFDAIVVKGVNGASASSGYLRDIAVEGATVRPSGFKTGVKIDGMIQFEVDNVTIDNYDIGIDFINNCFGSMVKNCRTGYGVNVGLNLRTGAQSGNDLTFINNWLYGEVAAVHIANDCGGFQFTGGGRVSSNKNSGTALNDERGIVILGKDYITGTTGSVRNITIQGVGFEGFQYCWAIRSYDQVNLTLASCEMRPFDAPAIGFIKMTNAKQSKINLIKQEIKGQWSNNLISVAGTFGDFSINESNSFIDAIVKGNYYSGSSVLVQSQIIEGQAMFRSGESSKLLIGRILVKDNGNDLQMSTDWGATWIPLTGKVTAPIFTSASGFRYQLGVTDEGDITTTQVV